MPKWLAAILITCCMTAASTLHAQQMVWSVDATVMLNNREGDDDLSPDQTFMFTRLAPELGVELLDGQHVIKGGVAWYQPMIDDMSGHKVLPTLYYQYNRPDGWHVTLGMLPRTLMVQRLPRYLWSDSLNYCQPNLRGGMVQLVKPRGYAEIAIDWRQLQTETRREAFAAMASTRWQVAGPLSLGGYAQYSHLARTRHPSDDEHVHDDLLINPMATLDLARYLPLDSLTVAAGLISAYERNRGVGKWRNPAGFVATATARWRWLQLDETFYAGKNLMPLYPHLGSQLNLGDPYYHGDVYSRTDLTAHVVSNRFVDLSASLMLHFTDKTSGFWQQICCRFYLDDKLWSRRHDRDYLSSGALRDIY